jgi:hypothetical protein
MSILVMTTMTGTFNARAMPRCSLHGVSYANPLDRNMVLPGKKGVTHLLIPTKPLFAATINKQ